MKFLHCVHGKTRDALVDGEVLFVLNLAVVGDEFVEGRIGFEDRDRVGGVARNGRDLDIRPALSHKPCDGMMRVPHPLPCIGQDRLQPRIDVEVGK